MSQPRLDLISPEIINRVLDEALTIIDQVGVKVQSAAARQLLLDGGARPSAGDEIIHIPPSLAHQALGTAPREFFLYNRAGEAVVRYGGDAVHFDPGSCGVHVLDPDTLEHRSAVTPDLVRLVQVAEVLPQYAAQSTAVVCHDVPKGIGDIYRLYLVLRYSAKPVVTGSFSVHTTQAMIDLLAMCTGGRQALAAQPLAVFDVCPTPPLIWSHFAAQSLIDLGRARVPAEIVSMPLAGAAAPVTLLGAVTQHAAECLSGIALHQLAGPGAPIVWGGAPAVFDMRYGTTPMGAIETALIDVACAQVGKSLGLPTHAYLGASDAKIVDAQAGLESSQTALLGALAGINMISGAGMLDFLACQSAEKLVLDAEAIGQVQRLLEGLQIRTTTLALEMFAGINFKADFLKQKTTRQLFSKEQHLPSAVIDRGSIRAWEQAGRPDAFTRARRRVDELLATYRRPEIVPDQETAMTELVSRLAREAGLDHLPELC